MTEIDRESLDVLTHAAAVLLEASDPSAFDRDDEQIDRPGWRKRVRKAVGEGRKALEREAEHATVG
jgi:hypothetical protein